METDKETRLKEKYLIILHEIRERPTTKRKRLQDVIAGNLITVKVNDIGNSQPLEDVETGKTFTYSELEGYARKNGLKIYYQTNGDADELKIYELINKSF